MGGRGCDEVWEVEEGRVVGGRDEGCTEPQQVGGGTEVEVEDIPSLVEPCNVPRRYVALCSRTLL